MCVGRYVNDRSPRHAAINGEVCVSQTFDPIKQPAKQFKSDYWQVYFGPLVPSKREENLQNQNETVFALKYKRFQKSECVNRLTTGVIKT